MVSDKRSPSYLQDSWAPELLCAVILMLGVLAGVVGVGWVGWGGWGGGMGGFLCNCTSSSGARFTTSSVHGMHRSTLVYVCMFIFTFISIPMYNTGGRAYLS